MPHKAKCTLLLLLVPLYGFYIFYSYPTCAVASLCHPSPPTLDTTRHISSLTGNFNARTGPLVQSIFVLIRIFKLNQGVVTEETLSTNGVSFIASYDSFVLYVIEPLHKWRLNSNNNTFCIFSLVLLFQDKGF